MKNKTLYLGFTLVCLLANTLFAQITFERTYGSVSVDASKKIIQTFDGNYAVIGYHGIDRGLYLVKSDTLGTSLWQKTYAPISSFLYYEVTGCESPDSGFVLTATKTRNASGTNKNIFLLKTNSIGDTLWSRYISAPPGFYSASSHDVINTIDGGYAIIGSSGPDLIRNVFLIKTDYAGNVLWAKSYGGPGDEVGNALVQSHDGGFVITGYTTSFGQGGQDVYIVKTDSIGNLMWTKTFGGSRYDFATSIHAISSGGYIITGVASEFGTGTIYDEDLFLLRIDSSGNNLWSYTYGTDLKEQGLSVKETSDKGFIVTGLAKDSGSMQEDVYLLKTDSGGIIMWSNTIGGSSEDEGTDVIQDGDYFIISGSTKNFNRGYHDLYLIKTDSLGMSSCNSRLFQSNQTLLPWLDGSGGVESNGFELDSGIILINEPDSIAKDACICESPVAFFTIGLTHNYGYCYNLSTWADNWLWDFGDGSTSSLENPDHNWPNGNYTICLTVSNACGSDTYCDSISAYGGIIELLRNYPFEIYPNPFKDRASIKFENSANERLTIELLNHIGQKVKVIENIYGNSVSLEKGKLSPGIYFILLKSNTQVLAAKKVLIQ
jgi:hypothetical protein